MSKQVQRLKKEYPNLEEHKFYVIDGDVVVLKKELEFFLKCQSRTIERYEKDGLERSKYSINRLPVYDPMSSYCWQDKNVQQKFKPNRSKEQKEQTPQNRANLDEFLASLPPYKREIFEMSELDYMDRLAKLRDIDKKETANLKEREQLIDKDDVDKNMTTLAGLLTASLINYEDAAPAELENKSKEDISKIIYDVHVDVFNELDMVVNKHFDCDESFYEVMAVAFKQITNGATPLELIERLNVDSSK